MNLEVKAKNYIPGTASWAEGILGPRGDVGFFMVADFIKSQAIILELISTGKTIKDEEMGLDGDWDENSMTIYKNGKFIEYNCYRESIWAEPIMIVNYFGGDSECFSVWKREEK